MELLQLCRIFAMLLKFVQAYLVCWTVWTTYLKLVKLILLNVLSWANEWTCTIPTVQHSDNAIPQNYFNLTQLSDNMASIALDMKKKHFK